MGPQSVAGRRDPLLAAICHDLRAPLAAVTMGANFVLQTTPDDDASMRQRRILEAMLRSCAQMERLVRNFADLSEIEGGTLSLKLADSDAREIAELAVQNAQDAARMKNVSILADAPDERVIITCDRDRVLRALGHVVDNAVRAAPPESVVVVAASPGPDGIAFSVTDEGDGIAPAVKKNLFDREFHAKRLNRAGAGFGLSIAQGFATAHGGRIDVTSKPGATTVAIVIPTRGADPPRPVRSPRRRRR